jgi:hypothetical protein
MRGNLYFSLDEASIETLLSLALPRYSIVEHFHCTLQFACKYDDVKEVLGIPGQIRVISHVWDDECQAVRVEIPEAYQRVCATAHPHVTISVLDVQPVVAAALLLSPTASSIPIDGLLLCGSTTFMPFHNGAKK